MRVSALANVMDRTLPQAGLDLRKLGRAVRRVPGFVADARTFRRQCMTNGLPAPGLTDLLPYLNDAEENAGATSGHYFLQDLWAARRIFATMPLVHYDVGSRVDGFVSSLLVFCRVTVVDVRELAPIEGLASVVGNATALPFQDQSLRSMSSLHAMEHVGLGRYGDPIDAGGTGRAMAELARVVAPGGRLYFSVPVGRERTMFNAHRILSPKRVIDSMVGLELMEFSAIDDSGALVHDADPSAFNDANYACGLFEFSRSA